MRLFVAVIVALSAGVAQAREFGPREAVRNMTPEQAKAIAQDAQPAANFNVQGVPNVEGAACVPRQRINVPEGSWVLCPPRRPSQPPIYDPPKFDFPDDKPEVVPPPVEPPVDVWPAWLIITAVATSVAAAVAGGVTGAVVQYKQTSKA
jgi:hypothetical protein